MADIVTRCPYTGRMISTGLTTWVVRFDTLPNVPIPIVCPACGKTHYWSPMNAWTDDFKGPQRVSHNGHTTRDAFIVSRGTRQKHTKVELR